MKTRNLAGVDRRQGQSIRLLALVICLWFSPGLRALAETNATSSGGSTLTNLANVELLVKRAAEAAERAEAAAKRAEAAAKRAEAAQDQARENNATEEADALLEAEIRLATPEDEELRRVVFMVGRKYFDFNTVDRQARLWLTKDGHAPPKELKAVFEVADEKEFVTVKYGGPVGKRFWYVKFNKNMEVAEWGTRVMLESDE